MLFDGCGTNSACGHVHEWACAAEQLVEHLQHDHVSVVAGQLWPHASLAATGIIKEQLNPQLAMNKPKWISEIYLHRFNLGEEPPSISGVKVSFACI